MEKKEKSNIILSTAGMAVSKLGSLIYTFAIGLYVLKITGSGQSFAMTLLLGTLPFIILGPFVGNLADRINKKILVVGSDLLSGLLMSGLFVYALSGEITLPIIYGTTFLLSIFATFLETGIMAAQIDIVRKESLTRLGSLRQSTISIINLASPLLGGLIYSLVPIYIFLLINGISFIASAISEMFIDFKFNKTEVNIMKKESFFSDMKNGFTYYKKQPLLLQISKSAILLNFFLTSISVVLPFALINILKIDDRLYGIIMSATSIGALGGALYAGKMNSKLTYSFLIKGLLALGLFLTIMGIPLHSIFGGNYITLIIIGLSGFMLIASATALSIPLGVFLQTSVDPAYIGRVSSILSTMCGAMIPLAYLFFGFLTEHLSPFLILTSSGLLIVLIVLVTMLNNKVLKTLGSGTKSSYHVNDLAGGTL